MNYLSESMADNLDDIVDLAAHAMLLDKSLGHVQLKLASQLPKCQVQTVTKTNPMAVYNIILYFPYPYLKFPKHCVLQILKYGNGLYGYRTHMRKHAHLIIVIKF